jgi:hypothetical protein
MKISAAVIALPKIAPLAQAKQPGLGDAGATQDASAAEVVDTLPPQPPAIVMSRWRSRFRKLRRRRFMIAP